MTLVERVAQWPEQWRREGVAEGRRQGVARERALLRRLATMRFGDAAGEQVGVLLASTADANQLAAVEELIMGVENGRELVAGVAELLRPSH